MIAPNPHHRPAPTAADQAQLDRAIARTCEILRRLTAKAAHFSRELVTLNARRDPVTPAEAFAGTSYWCRRRVTARGVRRFDVDYTSPALAPLLGQSVLVQAFDDPTSVLVHHGDRPIPCNAVVKHPFAAKPAAPTLPDDGDAEDDDNGKDFDDDDLPKPGKVWTSGVNYCQLDGDTLPTMEPDPDFADQVVRETTAETEAAVAALMAQDAAIAANANGDGTHPDDINYGDAGGQA